MLLAYILIPVMQKELDTFKDTVWNSHGPLLFIIYMNDLPACIQDGRVTMYADDTSLSNKGKMIEDIENKLIPDLSRICSWLQVNKLNLNTK